MPINYTTPAWLNPRGQTDAEAYAKGFALGEARRAEQARVAAQMAQAQMQAAAQAQAQSQRTAMAQAELAAEVKKQEEAASVAREELAIKKQAQAQKDAFAAKKTAGILAIGQKVGSGGSLLEAMSEHPEAWMGESGDLSGLASVKRAFEPAPPIQPTVMTIPRAGTLPGVGGSTDIDVLRTGPNSWQKVSGTTERMDEVDKAKLGSLIQQERAARTERAKLSEGLEFMTPGSQTLKDRQKDISASDKKIADLNKQIEGMRKSAPAQTAAGAIRVRRKSDGKTFTYRGKREDVPNTYEILE